MSEGHEKDKQQFTKKKFYAPYYHTYNKYISGQNNNYL